MGTAGGAPFASRSLEWIALVSAQRRLYDGLAQWHAAAAHAEAFEWGSQVSRLTYAASRVAEASRLAPPAFRARYAEIAVCIV